MTTRFESVKRIVAWFYKRLVNGHGHRHEFLIYSGNQVAVWSKRRDVADAVYFFGTVLECECGAKRFRCDLPGCREVDVA